MAIIKAELYPPPPKPKDWVYDPKFDLRWLKLASNLWFRKFPLKVMLVQTGEEVQILSWRRAWFGPTFCLRFSDGTVRHGYDPATVRLK
jgi:hypothetical protein